MDGQVEQALWNLPQGLASQHMPGSSGEILEGLKQNKVLGFVNHGEPRGLFRWPYV